MGWRNAFIGAAKFGPDVLTDKATNGEARESRAEEFVRETGILERTQIVGALNLEAISPDPEYADIIHLIEADKVLTDKLLKVSNSAWFASSVVIDSVRMAFTRLGLKDFVSVALSAALRVGLGEGSDQSKVWQHADIVARMAEIIAQQLAPDLIDEAFLVGLLHDAAIPLMAHEVMDYCYLVDEAIGPDPACLETEYDCNEISHCDVGFVLAQAWNVAPILCEVIRHHHDGRITAHEEPHFRKLLSILILAEHVNALCEKHVYELFPTDEDQILLNSIAHALDRTRHDVLEALDEVARLHHIRVKKIDGVQ